MRQMLITVLVGLISLVVGVCVGVCFGPQLKTSTQARTVLSMANKVPWTKSITQADNNSPFESYDYPTIKWRSRPLAAPAGAIAQLWTRYEWDDEKHQSGKLNYILTVFKASDKTQCQVELLDNVGFKINQFDVTGFHPVPGAPDIIEARDKVPCTEDEYKRAGDYSIN